MHNLLYPCRAALIRPNAPEVSDSTSSAKRMCEILDSRLYLIDVVVRRRHTQRPFTLMTLCACRNWRLLLGKHAACCHQNSLSDSANKGDVHLPVRRCPGNVHFHILPAYNIRISKEQHRSRIRFGDSTIHRRQITRQTRRRILESRASKMSDDQHNDEDQ